MRRALLALIALAGLAGFTAAPPPVVLLTEGGDPASEALAVAVQKRLAPSHAVRRVGFARAQLDDPIEKGRLVASLTEAGVVVAVGDAAVELASRELEDVPVYFVGAAIVRGKDLASSALSGTLAYSPEDVLDAVPERWRRGIGLLYTPGYEGVVARIRSAAQARGGRLIERKIPSLKELPATAEGLLGSAPAVWVLGDPILARGAGLQYLVEASLSRGVALIGSEPSEVAAGAALCSVADREALAAQASGDIERMSTSTAREIGAREAPSGGAIVYQPSLAERFGLPVKTPRWRKIQ